jgi:HTH-type transcriptional regulator/antitoxin HigA
MAPRPIRTAEDYEAALGQLSALIDQEGRGDTSVADGIEILAVLLKDYESRLEDRLQLPSPLDAIRFRMEQLGLTQKDLIPFIGSASKVSEVLARKRPLSLQMIRALNLGLGIPAKVLLQSEPQDSETSDVPDWAKFPAKEMFRRGWIASEADRSVRTFIEPWLGALTLSALFKKTQHIRGNRKSDPYALIAWTVRVVERARLGRLTTTFSIDVFSESFFRDLGRLSIYSTGPRLAVEYLQRFGITLIIEPPLPRTYLDGAAILDPAEPVIGLTIRHDRVDNFWFTLFHELAHVWKHMNRGLDVFYDDLDTLPQDDRETEADATARNTLIPVDVWESSPASRLRSRDAVEHLARKLEISQAIVAGRIRRAYNSYSILGEFVGQGRVRKLFTDVSWDK